MKEFKKNIQNIIPDEYLGDIKVYSPEDFIVEMKEKDLFFEKKENKISHLAWWINGSTYKTEISNNLDFESLDKEIKGPLSKLFGPMIIIHFNYHSQGKVRWVAAEISSELFFTIGVLYYPEFRDINDSDFIFISSTDYNNWIIPSPGYLYAILTNRPVDNLSEKETVKPWQALFTVMNIEEVKPALDLFNWKYDNDYQDDLSPVLSAFYMVLCDYYYHDIIRPEGATPEIIFSFLADIANNKEYYHVFKNYDGKDHTLQWIIKKEIEGWGYARQDDMEGRFSRDAQSCVAGICDIDW